MSVEDIPFKLKALISFTSVTFWLRYGKYSTVTLIDMFHCLLFNISGVL